jgi:hypothetical protein
VEKTVNYNYYIEVIRNYEKLLAEGNSEIDAAYFLATVFPNEITLLLTQGYFKVLNN